mgnify:CR=1 FL=1
MKALFFYAFAKKILEKDRIYLTTVKLYQQIILIFIVVSL